MNPPFKKTTEFRSLLRLILVVIVSSVILTLTGCASKPEVIKEKIVYKAIVVPKNLLKKCKFSPPPYSPNLYAVMPPDQKEKASVDYINRLLAEGRICSDGFGHVSDFQDREIKIIQEAQP